MNSRKILVFSPQRIPESIWAAIFFLCCSALFLYFSYYGFFVYPVKNTASYMLGIGGVLAAWAAILFSYSVYSLHRNIRIEDGMMTISGGGQRYIFPIYSIRSIYIEPKLIGGYGKAASTAYIQFELCSDDVGTQKISVPAYFSVPNDEIKATIESLIASLVKSPGPTGQE